jgi:hypothetical protein
MESTKNLLNELISIKERYERLLGRFNEYAAEILALKKLIVNDDNSLKIGDLDRELIAEFSLLNLETAVESRKYRQALGAPRKTEKLLITNKVTTNFSVSLCTPVSYLSFSYLTAVSRLMDNDRNRKGVFTCITAGRFGSEIFDTDAGGGSAVAAGGSLNFAW